MLNLLVPLKVCIVALAGSIVQNHYPGRLFYSIPYSCTHPIGAHLPTSEYWEHNAAVLSAGGIGSWLSARLTLAKPATIVGMAVLLVGSSLALVVVRNAVVVILAQVVMVAGGVGINMVFTRLLHDSLSSRLRAGAASGVGA